VDRICVQMPENPREFFFAMPAIQAYIFEYVHDVAGGVRDPEFRFTFRMNDCYEPYELPLKVAANVVPTYDYTGWNEQVRNEYDCFIEFDFEAAKKIALCTGKHITESLGILIGSTPRKWPLLPQPRNIEGKGILVANWDGTSLMEEAVKVQKGLAPHCSVVNLDEPISMHDVDLLDVDTITGMVGPTSALTYLAAAYRRELVEIFPDEESYLIYNNEGIPRYQAIIGKPTAVEIMQAWRGLNIMQLSLQDEVYYDAK
jgi:hypothetical protein